MLRAAVLLSFLRRLQRFSTSGHPEALLACYAAAWPLARPDLHRLADDSFLLNKAVPLLDLDNLYDRPLATLVVLHGASDSVRTCLGKGVLPLGCEITQWRKMASPDISPAGR